MARLVNQPAGRQPKVRIIQLEQTSLASDNVAGGMNTEGNPANIKNNELTYAKNCIIRSDRVSRRPGTTRYTTAAPDARKVLTLAEFKRNDGQNNFVRFVRDSVRYTTAGSWVSVVGPALSGADTDRFRYSVIEDRLFFTNNGKEDIMELNLAANTYAALGTAGQYKYLTGFFNRCVAAYRSGSTPNPVEVGWSGDRNYAVWNPLTDISAGSTPLVESSSDLTDYISGVFGFTSVMIIPRERSIWYATKQASASNPFFFASDIAGIGTNAPDAIVRALDGTIFPDFRAQQIYFYQYPKKLTPIGNNIRRALFATVGNPASLFAGFDSVNYEYTLAVPDSTGSGVTLWKYNFQTESWTVDYYEDISCIIDVDRSASSITIDELVGTMDTLPGDYNSLSDPSFSPPQRLFGRNDGDIVTVVDGSNLTDYSSGVGGTYAYETDLHSKVFCDVSSDKTLSIEELYFVIKTETIGDIELLYSKDDGYSWITVKTWTIDATQLSKPITLKRKKALTVNRFMWRLRSTNCNFELLSYDIQIELEGEKEQSTGVT